VKSEIAHEAAQRGFDVGRVLRQQADEPQRLQGVALSDQKSDVTAARAFYAMRNPVIACRVRNPVVRIVEERHVGACFGQQAGRVLSQTLQDRDEADGCPEPDRDVLRSLSPGVAAFTSLHRH
jgi:hypothetical protein